MAGFGSGPGRSRGRDQSFPVDGWDQISALHRFFRMPNRIRSIKVLEPKARRREIERAFAAWFLAATLAVLLMAGCAVLNHPPSAAQASSGMTVNKTRLLLANPWIEIEIREFLGQPEVRDVLGFDPLSYETPFTLNLLEQRISKQGILRLFGATVNQNVYIHSRLFIDDASAGRPERGYDQNANAALRAFMLDRLSADPQVKVLYRNLLICHEVAHVAEWYALSQRQAVVRYTGHGISDRVEIRILTRLLQTGKIRPEVYAEVFLFYATFMNQDAEPEADVFRYYHQAVSSFDAISITSAGDPVRGGRRSPSAGSR